MTEPTAPQVIHQHGKPAFAVIPWDEYQRLIQGQKTDEADVWLPHEVVELNVIHGKNLIKAWREHFNLTQQQLADKSGLTQSAIARLETGDSAPRTATLKKIAAAMGITLEQLSD